MICTLLFLLKDEDPEAWRFYVTSPRSPGVTRPVTNASPSSSELPLMIYRSPVRWLRNCTLGAKKGKTQETSWGDPQLGPERWTGKHQAGKGGAFQPEVRATNPFTFCFPSSKMGTLRAEAHGSPNIHSPLSSRQFGSPHPSFPAPSSLSGMAALEQLPTGNRYGAGDEGARVGPTHPQARAPQEGGPQRHTHVSSLFSHTRPAHSFLPAGFWPWRTAHRGPRKPREEPSPPPHPDVGWSNHYRPLRLRLRRLTPTREGAGSEPGRCGGGSGAGPLFPSVREKKEEPRVQKIPNHISYSEIPAGKEMPGLGSGSRDLKR